MTTTFNDELGTDTPSLIPPNSLSLFHRYAGRSISEIEQRKLFSNIADHKWHMSERLRRDVGFTVAAVDYFENFHESEVETEARSTTISTRVRLQAKKAARFYFETKGASLPL